MSMQGYLPLAGLVAVAAWSCGASAQNPVRPTQELFEANALGVPIDPETRIDPASMPREINRRTLEPLGLTAEQLVTPRAISYSAAHLEDASGTLQVFYASVVKDETEANGKSIMGLLTLVAAHGVTMKIVCEGDDADAALAALVERGWSLWRFVVRGRRRGC